MSESTFHTTKEDIRKPASQESHAHGGNQQAGSDVAAMQSIIDTQDKSKASIIEERKSNLPLPDQPPVASDFNSSDASTTAVGSGGVNTAPPSVGGDALNNPTGDSAVRTAPGTTGSNVETGAVGREGLEGAIPNDAVARGSKDHAGLKDTTNKDYGYPHKSDPTS